MDYQGAANNKQKGYEQKQLILPCFLVPWGHKKAGGIF